jgi:hypothetical protein
MLILPQNKKLIHHHKIISFAVAKFCEICHFNLFDAEEMKYGCKDSYPMTFANWQRLVAGPEFFYYGHLVSAVLLCPSAGL